jgi:hypothetical protein
MVQAIETRYAGCRFRSRLEARWAVFFDELGIEWEYEPEGFEIDYVEGEPPFRYLPDFLLPKTQTWVEVKGSESQLQQDSERYAWIWDWGHMPYMKDSIGTKRGMLILGPIPRSDTELAPLHSIVQHYKGLYSNLAFFRHEGFSVIEAHNDGLAVGFGNCYDWFQWPLVKERYKCNMHKYGIKMSPSPSLAYEAARSARF